MVLTQLVLRYLGWAKVIALPRVSHAGLRSHALVSALYCCNSGLRHVSAL